MAGFNKTSDASSLGDLGSTDESEVVKVSDCVGFSIMLNPDGDAVGDILLYCGIDNDGSVQSLFHTETVVASTPVVISVDMDVPLTNFKVVANLSAGVVSTSYTTRK